MRVLFLNQYFPPDPAPTGTLFRELADRLEADGHEVDFVSTGEGYRGGHGKGGRMRRELLGLLRILISGLRRRRAEVVISGSSPPCLAFVAALVALWHRAKHLHWAMDLYPEIAVALGELRPGFIARLTGSLMSWSYRRAGAVVALDEDMAHLLRRHRIEPVIIRPWVFAQVLERRESALAGGSAENGKVGWTWIYSGNLGRAHEWTTILEAQAILEKSGSDIRLLFQGGGPSWPTASERAGELGLSNCDWAPYVEEAALPASLLQCDACVVTQLPTAQGMLWPSKLALVTSLPRPIVWIGPTSGAIASTLRELPQAGLFAVGDAGALADWLRGKRERREEPASMRTIDPCKHREEALEAWVMLVERSGKNG